MNLTPEQKEKALEGLKTKATNLGIQFHPNIGYDSLVAKIKEHTDAEEKAAIVEKEQIVDLTEAAHKAEDRISTESPDVILNKITPEQLKIVQLKNKCNALVRCTVTCNNPAKQDLKGEIFCVRNGKIPPIKKFIPFDGEPQHIPQLIVTVLQERECQVFTWVTDKRTGVKSRKGYLRKEFNVNILPHLTKDEIKDLADQQAMAGSIQ
jgi:hypothetical protein